MSASEAKDVRNEFSKIAVSYRRRNVIMSIILFIFAVGFWFMVTREPKGSSLFLTVSLFFGAFVILSGWFTTKLICPACNKRTEGEIVRFCPECGHSPLEEKGEDKFFLYAPRCRSCSKELSKGRGGKRHYKIRFCTCCGAWLDERGV